MSNGKGHSPRPFSVDQETYANNWDRIFRKSDICEYSGLPNTSSYDSPPIEYMQMLKSGMFWELYPELTGSWEYDKISWERMIRGK